MKICPELDYFERAQARDHLHGSEGSEFMRIEGPEVRLVTVRTKNSLDIFTGRCTEHAGWMGGREQQVLVEKTWLPEIMVVTKDMSLAGGGGRRQMEGRMSRKLETVTPKAKGNVGEGQVSYAWF